MKRTMIGAVLILGSMLSAAHADTWVFRDTLRPNGHDRSMAVKYADGRKCGTSHNMFSDGASFEQCMQTRGWTLDHIIPDSPSAGSRFAGPSYDDSAPVASSNDDSWVQRQQDQALQDMVNTQQMVNDQQQMVINEAIAAQQQNQ
jgi:hypothetical protein